MSSPAGAGVLATSPEELRAAARMLREVGQEASGLTRTLGLGVAGGGWIGLAALEQRARVESLQSLLGLVPVPGEETARLLERCAFDAEDAGARVRSSARAREEALATAHRLRVGGPPPDPAALETWRRLVAEAEAGAARALELIRQAEEDYDRTQREVAVAVREVWARVENGVAQIATLAGLGLKASDLKAKLTLVRVAAPGLTALAVARVRGGRLLRADAAVKAMDRLWEVRARQLDPGGLKKKATDVAEKVPWLPKVPPAVLARTFGVVTVVDGARSAVTGGGYEGWRGGVTRVLGGAVAAAVPASFSPVPPVALAGIATLGAYTTWTTGNWIYDNRVQIVEAGRSVVRVGRQAGRAVGSTVRDGLRAAGQAGRALRQRLAGAAGSLTFRTGRTVDRALARLREREARGMATLGGLADDLSEGLRRSAKRWEPVIGRPIPSPSPVDPPPMRWEPVIGRPIPSPSPVDPPPMRWEPVIGRPILPRLPVDLPSLPRLPVELPRPSLGVPWLGGAVS